MDQFVQAMARWEKKTLYAYETSAKSIPSEVLEQASKVLSQSQESLAAEPPDMQEDSVEYREKALALDYLSVNALRTLTAIMKAELNRLPEAQQGRHFYALMILSRELKERGAFDEGQASSGLSDELAKLASAVVDRADHEHDQSPPKLPTGARAGDKDAPLPSASSGSKGPRPTLPGKAQK